MAKEVIVFTEFLNLFECGRIVLVFIKDVGPGQSRNDIGNQLGTGTECV